MGLTIVNKNEIFVAERFVVNKKDNKFYITINSKYVIPGILSNVFFDEKDVISRLVTCLSEHKVFDIEKEFHSFNEPLTTKEYTEINSSQIKVEIVDSKREEPSNKQKDPEIDFTGEFSSEESADFVATVNNSISDLFKEEAEFSSDLIKKEELPKDDIIEEVPEGIKPDTSPVESAEEVELTAEEIDNRFWATIATSAVTSIGDTVTSTLDKQQRLHEEGKLSKEEIDKVNNTNKKYVSVMNADRAKNKIEYFNNISASESVVKDKSSTVDKLKLSFKGILRLLSLTE